ncbi:hypothetical protein F5X97DRAFT_305308 [Nemania serpens]|nr:hypothetical protein F5X97DRAFT_305308 [Nemania serpens]
MATLTAFHSQWHPGEQAVQRMLGVPSQDNPTVHGLKQAHAYRVLVSPLVAFGTLDERGRPWVTVWGGEAGFSRPIAENVLGVNGITDGRFDPVTQALFAVHDVKEGETEHDEKRIIDDEVIRPAERKVMAALSIDLETRDRLKLAGHFIAGAATATTPGVVNVQMAFAVEEALGNCPKYLNKKRIVPNVPTPELLRSEGASATDGLGLPLPREAIELIAKADLFFIASKHGNGSMDVNHRGGPPGFLRVFRNLGSAAHADADGNDADGDGDTGVVLVYPEYSGNRLYQTLGNLREDPVVGLVIPDFETGDVLYLTGTTTLLVAERAAAYMPRAKLAVRIDVAEARFVRNGLPFRGTVIDYSPYNPPVRRLAAEQEGTGGEEIDGAANAVATATLLTRQIITPSIAKYVFRITPTRTAEGSGLSAWYPGQHVTFDFSPELDHGYSHMRDDDPQSLNDDFVRTFTVSAPLDPGSLVGAETGIAVGEERGAGPRALRGDAEPELEIIARRHGSATAFLATWNMRVPLEIPIVGFGGGEDFRMPVSTRRSGVGAAEEEEADGRESVFVAGGVGITPLLAQAAGVLGRDGKGGLKVLWSLRAEDLALAVYAFEKIGGLGPVTKLFVTGSWDGTKNTSDLLGAVKNLGAEVEERRMDRDDILRAGEKGKWRFFCCTGPALMRVLLQWMEGEEVVFESFEY